MTKEELMLKRWKVTSDWPNNDRWHVGDIIQPSREINVEPENFYDQYPHLFRKLEWWEERKVEEMPEYVKVEENGLGIVKVDKWFMLGEDIRFHLTKPWLTYSADYCEPATLEEYTTYLSKQH